MNALIAQVFPVLVALAPAAPFLLFAACMALQLATVLAFFPETKRAALDALPTTEFAA